VTAEDPVQFLLPGINQFQVKAQEGPTYAAALNSFLWQDADVIMVGELRDSATAELAIEAALTEHLVLSSMLVNDAISALSRLMGMGLDPFWWQLRSMRFAHNA